MDLIMRAVADALEKWPNGAGDDVYGVAEDDEVQVLVHGRYVRGVLWISEPVVLERDAWQVTA